MAKPQVAPGEINTIFVSVKNTGGTPGTEELQLKVEGAVVKSSEVELDPGESSSVSFEVSRTEEGSYDFEVNGLTGTFVVEEEAADIGATLLSVTSKEVEPGEEVKISVKVTNTGEIEGDYDLNFVIEGSLEETKTVTLGRENRRWSPFR